MKSFRLLHRPAPSRRPRKGGIRARLLLLLLAPFLVTNTAMVSGGEGADSDGTNNSATIVTTVLAEVDLAITKDDSVTSAVPGESVDYLITVSNLTPLFAVGALVTDFFPDELTCTWTCTALGATCTAGPKSGDLVDGVDLPAATRVLYQASCVIDPGATGTLSNTATVEVPLGTTDSNPSNNTATSDTDLVPEADLSITKTDAPDPVATGAELTYTLTVTNNGPSTATGVTVTDTLPAEVTLSSGATAAMIFADGFESGTTAAWSSSQALRQAVAVQAATCSESAGTVTCDVGDLASGESVTIELVVVDTATTGEIKNTATVTGNATDPDLSNNTATATTTVKKGVADLQVTVSDSPDPVAPGGVLTYTVTVLNLGPSGATGVALESDVPTEFTVLSIAPQQGGCRYGSATEPVLCDLDSLAPGASITVTIEGQVSFAATEALTHPAAVTSDYVDLNLGNNVDTETTRLFGSLTSLALPSASFLVAETCSSSADR